VDRPDYVVVGGGIAGAALATVLARAGAHVVVLERQTRYRDHVRGEILWSWGARLARELGIEQTLRDAGAIVVRWVESYDEGASDPERDDAGAAFPEVEGSINIDHPTACAALAEAAATAGADVRFGVGHVQVEPGDLPSVRWTDGDGTQQQTTARLVVGADGRRSSVRAQAAIPFEVDPPAHLVAGLLAEGIDGSAREVNLQARESDLLFFSFPQRAGRARLYFCFPTADRARFAGPDGAQRFLAASKLACLSEIAGWDDALPAGPCATFPGEDSRAPFPIADGVVLVGDAAGYENPLQGQGLSMTMQDVHDVSAALLAGSGLHESLEHYAEARAVRQRLANISVALEVWANDGYETQDPEERASRYEHVHRDEILTALVESYMLGPGSLPQDLTHADLAERLSQRES